MLPTQPSPREQIWQGIRERLSAGTRGIVASLLPPPTAWRFMRMEEADDVIQARRDAALQKKGKIEAALNDIAGALFNPTPEDRAALERRESILLAEIDREQKIIARCDRQLKANVAFRLAKERKEQAEAQAQKDLRVRVAGEDFLTKADRMAATIQTFASEWAELQDAHREYSYAIRANPILGEQKFFISLELLIPQEIARASRIIPGDNLETSDAPPGIRKIQSAHRLPSMMAQIKSACVVVDEILHRSGQNTTPQEDASCQAVMN